MDELRVGDEVAAQQLWERYYVRLVDYCRKKLGDHPRRVSDEEDVAVSAFTSFYRGAEEGRFPRLDDRDDLWQVLVMIAARKAATLIQHEYRQKRGGGRVRGDSVLADGSTSGGPRGFELVIGNEPTPEIAASVAEEYGRLMELLDDGTQQSIARLKLEGYSNEEIAKEVGWSLRTVERKLLLIRTRWSHEMHVGE